MDKVIQIANLITDSKFHNPQVGRVYSGNGICPCIDTMGGGNREPKFMIICNQLNDMYSDAQTNVVIKKGMTRCHSTPINTSDASQQADS